jgi:hypothetical protein
MSARVDVIASMGIGGTMINITVSEVVRTFMAGYNQVIRG